MSVVYCHIQIHSKGLTFSVSFAVMNNAVLFHSWKTILFLMSAAGFFRHFDLLYYSGNLLNECVLRFLFSLKLSISVPVWLRQSLLFRELYFSALRLLAVFREKQWSSSHLTDLFLEHLRLLERADPSVMTPR